MQLDITGVLALPKEEFGCLAAAVFARIESEGGFLPREAYFAKVRAFPTIFTEIVCICHPKGSEAEILLEKRSVDDPYWPGQYCTQGITVMPRQAIIDVAESHAEKECRIPFANGDTLEFAGCVHLPRTRREHGLCMLFIRPLLQKPEKFSGEWHPLNRLPETLIPHISCAVIPAIKAYLSTGIPCFVEYLGEE